MTQDRLPKSKLMRLSRLARFGARAGAAKLAGLLGAEHSEAWIANAAKDALGEMRGLALKLGQLVSYIDGFVPEEHQELYEEALAALRDAAPPMSSAAAERVVREDLGRP